MNNEKMLKIDLFCPECGKKIKVSRLDVEFKYDFFEIDTVCEYCTNKIDISYSEKGLIEVINR